jgi:tRNA(Ile)-lysidine synthase
VCYFDHKLRTDSEKEKKFITQLAKKHSFEIEIAECDIKAVQKDMHSVSIEELARTKRYEFLEKIREKYHTSYVITAHHLDDKIETFFFNLIRGSKLTGLINMKDQSGHILRPLLKIEKKEILTYLQEKKIKFMIDTTNSDMKISRNYIRLQILPQFEKVNPSYKKNISNIIQYLEAAKEHIDSEIQEFL